MKYSLIAILLGFGSLLSPGAVLGQQASGPPTNAQYPGGLEVGAENLFVSTSVEVEVEGPNGSPIVGPVYVTLLKDNGQVFKAAMARAGKAQFANVPKTGLTAQVVASGYETARKAFEVLDRTGVQLKIDLQPMADKEAAASDRGITALNPKAQKDIGRALEALRANKPIGARQNLQAAQRDAPNSAEVEYLFGVYSSQMHDMVSARSYWTRALELNPSHLSALLSLSQDLLREQKAAQSAPYLNRALEIEPSSWRAHMLLAQADLFQGKHDDAVEEAERAIELGHERAASAQPLLAHALFKAGDKDRAILILQNYVPGHPADANAAKLLERLKTAPATSTASGATMVAAAPVAEDENADLATDATTLIVPMNWLPPDIDEKIPPVELGAACPLDDVVRKAGSQLVTFVHDVDRFTATETLIHQSINKYGIASAPEKRKFDYLVSIQDLRGAYLGVTEYRNGGGAQTEFPDGIVTNGLPALALVFHPYYAPNYEMTCEGLARSTNGLAWQIHFRQKPGKPNAIKSFQFGLRGPSYPVALKGRAWISADNYQLLRMETDIVAPIPEIRLISEHTAIEYGPVKFRQGNVTLWLPESAEVHFAWGRRQIHRRHSFSNYLLFGVDEKERIAPPKQAAPPHVASPASAESP